MSATVIIAATQVKALARALSVSRLSTYARLQDLAISETPAEPPVHGHWMSLILVAGPAVKIIFKAHFMSATARTLSEQVYQLRKDEISIAQATDFMKEYCNLTAGALKRALEAQSVLTGVSLPLLVRGFDEIFSAAPDEQHIFGDCWSVGNAQNQVSCSVVIEIYDSAALSKLDLEAAQSSVTDDGEVEFL